MRRLRRRRAPVQAPCPCSAACTPGRMIASTRRTRQPAIIERGASCYQLECAETVVQSHERQKSTHVLHTSCCWRCGLSLRAMTEAPVQVSLPGWHQQLVRHLPVQVDYQEHPRTLQQRRPLFRQRRPLFRQRPPLFRQQAPAATTTASATGTLPPPRPPHYHAAWRGLAKVPAAIPAGYAEQSANQLRCSCPWRHHTRNCQRAASTTSVQCTAWWQQ